MRRFFDDPKGSKVDASCSEGTGVSKEVNSRSGSGAAAACVDAALLSWFRHDLQTDWLFKILFSGLDICFDGFILKRFNGSVDRRESNRVA